MRSGVRANSLARQRSHGVRLLHGRDVPIGAWTTALALDVAANGDPAMRRAATFAMGVGLAGAAGAA